jgi:hypothetical protein
MHGSLTEAAVKQIGVLSELAQTSVEAGDSKSAADLLRAGEHLAFGSIAANAKESSLSDDLVRAVNREYEHLVDKADEHWERHEDERPSQIEAVYASMRESAEEALNRGAFRKALEFARGAAALAHVRRRPAMLESGAGKRGKLPQTAR